MRLGVPDHRGHHPLGNAPLGLQVEQTLFTDPRGIPLGPLEIGLRFDDHFQFVGPPVSLLQRGR